MKSLVTFRIFYNFNLILLMHSPKQYFLFFPNSQILKKRKAIFTFSMSVLRISLLWDDCCVQAAKGIIVLKSWSISGIGKWWSWAKSSSHLFFFGLTSKNGFILFNDRKKKNQKMSNISGNKNYTEFGVFYFQDEGVDELLGISSKYI